MKTLFVALFCISISVVNAQSVQKNFIDLNYIEVTAKAEMEIVPDEIYIKIVVDEKDNKAKQSLEVLEKGMYVKLKEMGIDVAKDLAIRDFSSNFSSYWLKKGDIYTMKEYQLIVHDSPTLGKVYIELEKLGISNISIEKVAHSKIHEYRKEVKIKAIKTAKNKAVYLAEAIDQSIGKAIYITEVNYNLYQAQAMASNIMVTGVSSYKSEQVPQIEFEKIKLESSIQAKFVLE